MTDNEYYDLPDVPLLDFLEQFKGVVEIKGLSDIRLVIGQLREFHLFESANDLQAWGDFLSDCVKSEFDESCLSLPLEDVEDIYVNKYADDHELEGGWLHEWELPSDGEDFYTAA